MDARFFRRDPRRFLRLGTRLASVGLVLLLLAGAAAGDIAGSASGAGIGHARVLAGTGGGGGGATGTVLAVNMTDAPSFDPTSLTAIAGSTVTFELRNNGNFSHSFTLSNQANVTLDPSTTSPAALYRYFVANASVNITLAPGANRTFSFDVPAAWASGTFEFVSVVPYQFQAGMSGFLNVTSAGGGKTYLVTDQTMANQLAFLPDAIEVNATSFPIHVELHVSNLGSTGHTWTLVATPNYNVTPSGFTSYFQSHPPAANVNVPTTSGVVVTANFTLTAKGAYMFICTIPGHFAAGMFGFLYVGVPVPSTPAPPSTAIVESWFLAGGATLLGLGGLLAVTAAYVGRFPPKHPKAPGHH